MKSHKKESVGSSRRTFSIPFSENLSDYIQKRKIEEGKRALRYTDRPAVNIALYLGFSSQSHFSRVFKKHAGVTPNEYRNEKRSGRSHDRSIG
ncbi:MAG: helix-turn-helix transcriptional regulator [Clostridia bacterium]|nr:helix-turn-helix transcriptional regulator [Clostridia bacterium]